MARIRGAGMALRVLTQNAQRNREDIAAICEDSGVDLKDCYQCGKCSAGCPIAAEADMTPREVIRNLQLGQVDAVLESKMPWYCVECGVCLVRCPQSVDLPALNEAICRLAMRKKKVSMREGERFMNIFLDNVQRKGVSDEAMLAGRFNLETGHFFQDVLSAPKMMQRGLLSFAEKGHELEGSADVKRIVRACREAERQKAKQQRAAERAEAAEERTRVAHERVEVLREGRIRAGQGDAVVAESQGAPQPDAPQPDASVADKPDAPAAGKPGAPATPEQEGGKQ